MKAFTEQLGLVLASILTRVLFFTYRILAIGAIVSLLTGWIFYLARDHIELGSNRACWAWPIGVLTLVLLVLTHKRGRAKDNPYRTYRSGVRGWTDRVVDRFIAWIGTLKYFTSALSLVEDPGSYKIRGDEIRQLIDTVLQPGDILLRGYDGYLDGVMIALAGSDGGMGKHFSHAALYVGDLNDVRDKTIVARRLKVMDEATGWVEATESQKEAVRHDPAYYTAGRQKVVHAMTRGVFAEDILTFLRCDYLAVLRLPEGVKIDASHFGRDPSLIRELAEDAEAIRASLLKGETVNRTQVLEAVHKSALGKIGSCYDFQFNDGKTHHRFSCSEFVYYCFKSIHCYIGLQLKVHGFLNVFFRRESITPADIYEAATTHKKLQVVWLSGSLKKE